MPINNYITITIIVLFEGGLLELHVNYMYNFLFLSAIRPTMFPLSQSSVVAHLIMHPSHSRCVTEKTCDTERTLKCTISIRHGGGAPQERIPERTCEQVVDVRVSQVVEQVRSYTVERILDVPVLEMVKQLAKLPNTVDAPGPQVVEELAEASKVSSQDRVHRLFQGQTIKTTGISPAEKIIEMPVTQASVAYAEDGKIAEKDLVVTRFCPFELDTGFSHLPT